MALGYIKSNIDGSEFKFSTVFGNAKPTLPEKFSCIKQLPNVLDQGSKPICVPCSISAYINWETNVEKGVSQKDNKVDLSEIFDRRHYEGDDGMEIKDALSMLKKLGVNTSQGRFHIAGYAMIGSSEQLKRALVLNGVCVGALSVYNTNKDEFWYDDASSYKGGHAIAIVGYDENGFIIRNSWGKSYGVNGYATMPYEDFPKFLELWTMWKL